MNERFARTRLLVGDEGVERLGAAHTAVFGLGGVGGYALEALARAGVGHLYLYDADYVDATNLNRQLLATENTLNHRKVDAARERVAAINPDCIVHIESAFLTPDNIASLIPETVRFAVEAIDTVTSKVAIIALLAERSVRFVSCMGAGGKLSPEGIHIADIADTRGCPLARAVRQILRKNGVTNGVTCVYTEECPRLSERPAPEIRQGKRVIGTIAYVPGLIGLTAAGVIIEAILGIESPKRKKAH